MRPEWLEYAFDWPPKLLPFDQFLPWLFPYHGGLAALEAVMEDLTDLMQRLLEIQSGGRQRSPELIAEDDRLMDGLQKRVSAGKPTQKVKLPSGFVAR